MSTKKKKTIVWYSRGGNVAKMGPYESQVKASEALLTTDGTMIENAFVWPEEEEDDVNVTNRLENIEKEELEDFRLGSVLRSIIDKEIVINDEVVTFVCVGKGKLSKCEPVRYFCKLENNIGVPLSNLVFDSMEGLICRLECLAL